MTTNDKQPTGWVVVDFSGYSIIDVHGWKPAWRVKRPFSWREDAESLRESWSGLPETEVHPWPLPAAVLARLKERHPDKDWSQVPVAGEPAEKPGRWVVHDLYDARVPYRDQRGQRECAGDCTAPWATKDEVEGFIRSVGYDTRFYVPVNLDDLPAPAASEPSEVEKLRAEVESLRGSLNSLRNAINDFDGVDRGREIKLPVGRAIGIFTDLRAEVEKLRAENAKLSARVGWLDMLDTEEGRRTFADEKLRVEVEELRGALIECVKACGGIGSQSLSTEFLLGVPAEVDALLKTHQERARELRRRAQHRRWHRDGAQPQVDGGTEMTTNDKQPTGWVVVNFESDPCVFYADGWYGCADIFECIRPYPSREEAAGLCGAGEEPHPWPLPASVIARLKAKHPGQDWSQVPVAEDPAEKPGRWVIEDTNPGHLQRFRDSDGWHYTVLRCLSPWATKADAELVRDQNYEDSSYRVVNLDDLPAKPAEPSEVEKLRVENAKLSARVGWLDMLDTEEGRRTFANEALRVDVEELRAEVEHLTRERDNARASLKSVTKHLRKESDEAIRERDEARAELAKSRLSRLDEFAKAALTGVCSNDGFKNRSAEEDARLAVDSAQATIRAIDGAGGA